ncbi:MAG: CPBP family intramembrane metalloprotease, partial [Kiritimatiellae bacterium]|nr:CPBP family intramembrane metalloprotease [Kiritimatiellia bacterium]
MSPNDKTPDLYLLIKIVLLFVFSVLAGGLLAPPIYNGLISLGRVFEPFSVLRELEFEKLVSRCVLISVLIGAFLMMRCAGLVTLEKQGFERGVRWKTWLAGGFILGMVSMALLLLASGLTGAYVPGAEWAGSTRFWLKMIGNLVGALLVGYIEEWLFRGVIFGTLRKAVGVAAGVLVASVFFSVVH